MTMYGEQGACTNDGENVEEIVGLTHFSRALVHSLLREAGMVKPYPGAEAGLPMDSM